MNRMTQAFKTPDAEKECHYLYNQHYVHIEGEAVRKINETSILPLYKVRIGTEVCYCGKSAVDIRTDEAKATVDVSLRSEPNMLSSVVDLIHKGSTITVYDVVGEFLEIEFNGKKGYIKANTCDHKEPYYEGKNDGEKAVTIAKSKLGCKYVLDNPSTGPYIFDCSGLMLFVYNRLDIWLNRTASQQIYGLQDLTNEPISKWLPGDVITYHTDEKNPEKISHVGMYIGNETFIHASTNGYKVRTDNYTEYTKKYKTAHVARYFKV